MTATVTLGVVSFLNARPLTAGLENDGCPFQLRYDVPSRCASALAAGEIDVGLIPVIEYARASEPYSIVPGAAIACRGPVHTVRLFHREPLQRVGCVAVDISSRTSIALLEVLLRERYGLAPKLVPAAPDLDAMLHHADAALMIGDPVLPLANDDLEGGWDINRQSLDLGREWFELTGLPFVFAFWAGRSQVLQPEHVAALQLARQTGEASLTEIAAGFQRERSGSVEIYERYLRSNIRFHLGAEELAGLCEFFRLAHRHRVLNYVPELRFYPESGA
ncbi:MAG: menaquinone biosynthesis protein [Candidatus Latescibacterota bacterium]|nr:menaquinone biosynthesis protein [Candidatus Latescibacterota bacterium]